MPETDIGEVSGLAFGGSGIIRQDGLVVFIPFAAVGDTLKYRIVQVKKNFAIGAIVNILKPSPQRVKPLCPYFGVCGGCQLQHLNYEAQLEAKRSWLQEALKRQTGVEIDVPPVMPAKEQWAYRRRISWVLKPQETFFRAGYIAVDNASLVEAEQCPIFLDRDAAILPFVHEIAGKLVPSGQDDGKATIMKADGQSFLLHLHFKHMPKNANEVLQEAMKKQALLRGILATSPQKTLSFGTLEAAFRIEGLAFAFSPKAFIQAHSEQSQNVYRELCKEAAQENPQKVLDLYCGIGVSSLLLAKQGFHVMGIESNAEAVRLAQHNAKANGLAKAAFLRANVENVIDKLLSKENYSIAVLNPPREGLFSQIACALVNKPPKKLLYISCMPSTLARDLKILCQSTYRLSKVKAFDMFPQTTHLETFAVLERR
jgi:23S rRNA (uracil1939-C5)-methyltransferase